MPMCWESLVSDANPNGDMTLRPSDSSPPSGRPRSANANRNVYTSSQPLDRPERPRSAGPRRLQAALNFKWPYPPLARTGGWKDGRQSREARRVCPAELGLGGPRVLTLPSHVSTCDQGEDCAWRWLAHAALQDATWARQDLDTERQEQSARNSERERLEHDTQAFAELRGAHGEAQRELAELRVASRDLAAEVAVLRGDCARAEMRTRELERQAKLSQQTTNEFQERETASKKRIAELEVELVRTRCKEEESTRLVNTLLDEKTQAHGEIARLRAENARLTTAILEAEHSRQRKARPKGSAGRHPSGRH